MPALAECATNALEPYVGRTVADTCVRATAISVGKSADTLTAEDLPGLEASIRRLLSPIAASTTIDAVIQEIERECQ